MKSFLKILMVFGGILLFFPIILVVFIIAVMGLLAAREEMVEKRQASSNSAQQIYTDGRKTVESFGSRKEFAILRFSLEKDKQTVFKNARWSLYDRDNDKSIDSDVECYKKMPPYVYFVGSKGYTKLNYETAEIKQNKDLSGFSEEDKEVFNKIDDKNHD